ADDWSFVSLSFHGFGDAADAAITPEIEPEPTSDQLDTQNRELNTTDLAVTQTDSPDPVAAGTDLAYALTVENLGNNPANSVQVVETLAACRGPRGDRPGLYLPGGQANLPPGEHRLGRAPDRDDPGRRSGRSGVPQRRPE